MVPKVVEAILNMPQNTHVAVRYTSVLLLGELCEWIEKHPESLGKTQFYRLFLSYVNNTVSKTKVTTASNETNSKIASRHVSLYNLAELSSNTSVALWYVGFHILAKIWRNSVQ